jgi:hypothetical protein
VRSQHATYLAKTEPYSARPELWTLSATHLPRTRSRTLPQSHSSVIKLRYSRFVESKTSRLERQTCRPAALTDTKECTKRTHTLPPRNSLQSFTRTHFTNRLGSQIQLAASTVNLAKLGLFLLFPVKGKRNPTSAGNRTLKRNEKEKK